jgi:hypothetical protein
MMNWHENEITILPLQLVSSNGMGEFQKMHCKNGSSWGAEDWSYAAVDLPLSRGDHFYQTYMKLIKRQLK